MEKNHKRIIVLVSVLVILLSHFLNMDYANLAESGLTLCSIVLAVYVAAIIGLINTELSRKMSKTVSKEDSSRTQLGVLSLYFKHAIFCAVITIVISSMIIIEPTYPFKENMVAIIEKGMSLLGLVSYFENFTFFAFIVQFMINRQMWDL